MILLVDDDGSQRRMTGAMLSAAKRSWLEAEDGEAALRMLASPVGGEVRLVLLDLIMPGMDGFEVLKKLRPAYPDLPVIVLTANGSVANAVAAMKAGAQDFIIKPVSPERLTTSVSNVLEMGALKRAIKSLAPNDETDGFGNLVARSPATQKAIRLARRGAQSDIPVLIEGESGVGKEVFARAMHASSARRDGPFVAVNCGALPETLIESILFGHEKGAFTGAVARRIGKFEEANGGVLFLDEVGELPLDAQVKLLRAIQQGEVDPVGGARMVRTDFRLISATNRDLADDVAKGRFREDLYYRVSVFPLLLPPLRERREDIIAMARMFAERFAAQEGTRFEAFSPDAAQLLENAAWPGNVRQLENTIYRAIVLSEKATLSPEDFPHVELRGAPESARRSDAAPPSVNEFLRSNGHIRSMADIEKRAVETALRLYDGSMSEAARRLGIGRSTLYRKTRDIEAEALERQTS